MNVSDRWGFRSPQTVHESKELVDRSDWRSWGLYRSVFSDEAGHEAAARLTRYAVIEDEQHRKKLRPDRQAGGFQKHLPALPELFRRCRRFRVSSPQNPQKAQNRAIPLRRETGETMQTITGFLRFLSVSATRPNQARFSPTSNRRYVSMPGKSAPGIEKRDSTDLSRFFSYICSL